MESKLGATIRQRRHALGLTVGELAVELDKRYYQAPSKSSISRYEVGTKQVGLPALMILSDFLAINLDEVRKYDISKLKK